MVAAVEALVAGGELVAHAVPTARWYRAGSWLRKVRPLRRVATQLGEVLFDSFAAEPRRDRRSKPNRSRRSCPDGGAQDLSNLFFGGAPMGSGPTLERVLHVLIELADPRAVPYPSDSMISHLVVEVAG